MGNKLTRDQIDKLLAKTSVEDFDGHTDFQALSPKQKLIWLSSTAYFVYTIGKNNPDLGCSNFIDVPSKNPV